MRTLLVDNHDSYTYNLGQLVAAVTGSEPVVLRNDAAEWDGLDLAGFDCAVISPGPGRPSRPRDLGRCPDVLARADLPVLGVCLGHQAIAAAAGGLVGPAPQARHGQLSRIRHDGQGLFAGLPQRFAAVRYHSLCVAEPLPPTLLPTAWAEDGVLMALRHRDRPHWGVQFHPESVATEHGAALIANFARLVAGFPARRRPVPGPAARPPRAVAPDAAAPGRSGAEFAVTVRRLPVAVDPERAFLALYAASPTAFWLDSSRVTAGLSRFSFLGDAGGPLAEVLSYRVGAGAVEVRDAAGRLRREPGTIFDVLAARLRRLRVTGPALPFELTGGYVGYFGYELKADCGGSARHRSGPPDAVWLFADRLVAVDHATGACYVLALDPAGAGAGGRAWVDRTADRLAALPPGPAPAPPPTPVTGTPVHRLMVRGRDRYLADVAECRRQLLAGESYEICLTDTAVLPAPADPLAAYRHLRRTNPAPYAAFFRAGGLAVAGASPERFLRITADRVVESRPVKGTAPRAADPAVDEQLRRALAAGAKTRAENLMIVDLLRNDLGRVCAVGSVAVPRLMSTESYATVHQLVSTVRGRLRPGVGAVDCVRAAFPGGSMTGAPKLRTMEILDRLETRARGVYAGALGWLGPAGTADLSIVIRTLVSWHGTATAGAGGAIVLDSDPAEEYAEMLLKAAVPVAGLVAAGDPVGAPG